MKKLIGIHFTSSDGVVMELSSKEHCINEIEELRKTIHSVQESLKKFQAMKLYVTISDFEKKYIEDALRGCYSALNVEYVSE